MRVGEYGLRRRDGSRGFGEERFLRGSGLHEVSVKRVLTGTVPVQCRHRFELD